MVRRLREIVPDLAVIDLVRIYPLGATASRSVIVVGARTIEEHQDFWIVR